MFQLKRCYYQLSPPTSSLLFKEQVERCKNCAYDSIKNKECKSYIPTYYDPDDVPKFIIHKPLEVTLLGSNQKFVLPGILNPKLNPAVLPISRIIPELLNSEFNTAVLPISEN